MGPRHQISNSSEKRLIMPLAAIAGNEPLDNILFGVTILWSCAWFWTCTAVEPALNWIQWYILFNKSRCRSALGEEDPAPKSYLKSAKDSIYEHVKTWQSPSYLLEFSREVKIPGEEKDRAKGQNKNYGEESMIEVHFMIYVARYSVPRFWPNRTRERRKPELAQNGIIILEQQVQRCLASTDEVKWRMIPWQRSF